MTIMSFGVGAFMFVVVDSLLVEARRDPLSVNWFTKSILYIGFLVGLILHLVTR